MFNCIICQVTSRVFLWRMLQHTYGILTFMMLVHLCVQLTQKRCQVLLCSIQRKAWVPHMNYKQRNNIYIIYNIKDSQLKSAHLHTGKVNTTLHSRLLLPPFWLIWWWACLQCTWAIAQCQWAQMTGRWSCLPRRDWPSMTTACRL